MISAREQLSQDQQQQQSIMVAPVLTASPNDGRRRLNPSKHLSFLQQQQEAKPWYFSRSQPDLRSIAASSCADDETFRPCGKYCEANTRAASFALPTHGEQESKQYEEEQHPFPSVLTVIRREESLQDFGFIHGSNVSDLELSMSMASLDLALYTHQAAATAVTPSPRRIPRKMPRSANYAAPCMPTRRTSVEDFQQTLIAGYSNNSTGPRERFAPLKPSRQASLVEAGPNRNLPRIFSTRIAEELSDVENSVREGSCHVEVSGRSDGGGSSQASAFDTHKLAPSKPFRKASMEPLQHGCLLSESINEEEPTDCDSSNTRLAPENNKPAARGAGRAKVPPAFVGRGDRSPRFCRRKSSQSRNESDDDDDDCDLSSCASSVATFSAAPSRRDSLEHSRATWSSSSDLHRRSSSISTVQQATAQIIARADIGARTAPAERSVSLKTLHKLAITDLEGSSSNHSNTVRTSSTTASPTASPAADRRRASAMLAPFKPSRQATIESDGLGHAPCKPLRKKSIECSGWQ